MIPADVIPIRACTCCDLRKLDVRQRDDGCWCCDDCDELADVDAGFTEAPDDD